LTMLNFNVAQASSLVYNNEFKNCQLRKLGYDCHYFQFNIVKLSSFQFTARKNPMNK
jgi:hypothetical protein